MYQGKYTSKDASRRTQTKPQESETTAVANRPIRRPKPEFHKGTFLFYTIYFAFILIFLIVIVCLLFPLRDWLMKYESSQPSYMRQQIYQEYFANPDWEKIYTASGTQDTAFDNKTTYAAYMSQLVGDKELTCLETSAGLSGDKKFVIKLDDLKIASFTLTGGADSNTEIPQWRLADMDIFFVGNNSAIVEKLPGQTVYINGVALDDTYTIRSISTLAEDWLPDGIHGYKLIQQQVTDLLTEPTVLVKNADGSIANVTKNPETGIYQQSFAPQIATTEEKALALNAAQTYGLYMIRRIDAGGLTKHFASTGNAYRNITQSELGWTQAHSSYAFGEATYKNYYRYSDTLFSIHVDIILTLTRTNNSQKDHPISCTLFFTKTNNGWMVTEMTNQDVQSLRQQIRIRFMDGDTVLLDQMVDANAKKLTFPALENTPTAWATKETDASGAIIMTPVYAPDGNNEIILPVGTTLEPQTLYALYEEVGQ